MNDHNHNAWQGPDPWGDTPQLQDYNSSYNQGWQDATPPGPPKGPQKGPRQRGAGKIIALCLVCALAGGSVYPAYQAIRYGGGTTMYVGQRTAAELNTKTVDTEKELTPAQIYDAYVGSTVGITVDIVGTNIFGQQVKTAAAGSGFVITEDGYILTNYHVIDEANNITVTFVDGKSYPATLVGGEESNDIAVIKIDAKGLKPVVIGSSDDMRVGEEVLTIGNPLGELTFTETAGIVSALDRTITMSDGRKINMIQTDCAINSGNSGGALFNLHGEVVGITNAKYSSRSTGEASIDNIGFAIPINSVRKTVESIIENGSIEKTYIGVSASDVSGEARSYGLPQGAAIQSVTAGGPAEAAGLQTSDIVTAVNGEAITSSQDLVRTVGRAGRGDVLRLTVYRQGETLELSVTVAVRSQSALPEAGEETPQKSQASSWQSSQNTFPGFFGWYR